MFVLLLLASVPSGFAFLLVSVYMIVITTIGLVSSPFRPSVESMVLYGVAWLLFQTAALVALFILLKIVSIRIQEGAEGAARRVRLFLVGALLGAAPLTLTTSISLPLLASSSASPLQIASAIALGGWPMLGLVLFLAVETAVTNRRT